jgi:hypothetical protein
MGLILLVVFGSLVVEEVVEILVVVGPRQQVLVAEVLQ